jgi:hypothetical protein
MKENFDSFKSSNVEPIIHEGDPTQSNDERIETLHLEIAELEKRSVDAEADPFRATSIDAQIHGRKHEIERILRERSQAEAESQAQQF